MSVRDAAPGARLGMGLHGQADAHLRKSGVPYAILQPTGFMQTLPRDVRDGTMYGSYGSAAVNYIDTRDLADVAAALLTSPVGPDREYLPTGPASLSHERIAAEIGRAIGREIRYVNLSVAEMTAHLERQGVPQPFAGELAELQAETGNGGWAPTTTVVAELTGHEPRTWQDFLTDHKDAFA
ncbi:hypothetical protein ACFQQB_71550 [Nonomuraea rubra]|uniref:hypothetical protein n=1 Tax=Nonomuraea rubra TaxID=46180 RepID=UPI003614CBF0